MSIIHATLPNLAWREIRKMAMNPSESEFVLRSVRTTSVDKNYSDVEIEFVRQLSDDELVLFLLRYV